MSGRSEHDSTRSTDEGVRLTRRHFLGMLAVAGASMSGLLAACGGDDDDASTSTSAPTSASTPATGASTATTGTGAAQASPTQSSSLSSASPAAGTGKSITVSDPGMGQAAAPTEATPGGTLIVANEADMNEGDPQKYSGTHAGR